MRDELRYSPDPCVEPIIADVASFKDTAVKSCHGVGKTAFDANVLITAMCLVPELLTIQLSPTWRQVKDDFWNEVRKWFSNSPIATSMFEIAEKSPKMWSRIAPERWYAQGLASNKPGKVEGKHALRVLLIADEIKAIPDDMIEAVQGAMTSDLVWRLYSSTPSTPGEKFTRFYYCFTRHKRLWKTHSITADQSPRVSQKWVERMILEYGEDSQIVQARVYANFPVIGKDILIPLQAAEAMFREDSEAPQAHATIGVDVARFGGDETVISVWKGNVLVALKPFEKKSTTHTVKEVQQMVQDYDARVIVTDDIGVGGGVTDMLGEVYDNHPAMTIVPFVANAKSSRPEKFKSLGDEVVWDFAEAVKDRRVFSLVDDEKLVYQLTSYKLTYDMANRILVKWPEKREDRDSDSKSPDRGDAMWLGWYGSMLLASVQTQPEPEQTEEQSEGAADDLEFSGIRDKQF